MKRLCIIPARGGSKRLKGKNVKILGDKPLICHTIDSVIGLFDKIIITSDSENILGVVKDYYGDIGLELYLRPEELAIDTSKVIDTVLHYQSINDEYDQIWLCLPTCPLRDKQDVLNTQNLLNNEIDSIISITDYGFPPSLGLIMSSEGFLESYDKSDPWVNGNTRSQDQPEITHPNGAIYGAWRDSFKNNKNYYKGKTKGYYMPRTRSIDIDTQFEFDLAEFILKKNNNNNINLKKLKYKK